MIMSVVDLLDEWFESIEFKVFMSVSGIIGIFLGVCFFGIVYVLLYYYMGEIDGVFWVWGFCKGGMGIISMVIVKVVESFGVDI